MTKKSALEQALLESEEILRVVTENAKDMLYNQMKPEIDQNISEAIDMDDDKENEPAETPISDEPTSEPIVDEPSLEEPTVDDESPEADASVDMGSEEPMLGDEPAVEVPAMSGEPSDDTLDLTGASDDELLTVWKKLGDDAEIQVVKNDDGSINVNANGEELLIKLTENEKLINEEFENFEAQFGDQGDKYSFLDDKPTEPSHDEQGGAIFEIVMEEEVEADIPAAAEAPIPLEEEQPIEEVARTHADGRNMTRKPEGFYKYASNRLRPAVNEEKKSATDKVLITEAQVLKDTNAKLITENETLKTDLDKHKDALRLMKENLENVALFNSKLAYVNKIFCEHATTTDEKKSILERFDSDTITDQKDVKTLYKTISTEMKQTTIKESVDQKIGSTLNGTGEPLLESVSPVKTELEARIDRVKEIMNYRK